MLNNLPFISIITPCRNEENFIGKCLDSIVFQDYPKEKLEVLVVDGVSEDKTKEIIKNFQFSNPNFQIRVIDNPQEYTPFGLNIGIKEARGEIIMRMDAHAGYEKDYIRRCVECLQEYGADNVGGAIKTLPAKNTSVAKAIAFSLSSYFGVASDFRIGSKNIKEVDTVFGGCYKKGVFKKIGLFNENLKRSQDLEFNLRLKKAGGKILLVPDIVSYYYPSGTLVSFFEHNFVDGIWSILPLKFTKMPFKLRHYIPLLFVSSLLGSALLSIFFPLFFYLFLLISFLYLSLNLYFSVKISAKEKDFKLLFFMPLAFGARHIGYGLGSIFGLFKIFISKPQTAKF